MEAGNTSQHSALEAEISVCNIWCWFYSIVLLISQIFRNQNAHLILVHCAANEWKLNRNCWTELLEAQQFQSPTPCVWQAFSPPLTTPLLKRFHSFSPDSFITLHCIVNFNILHVLCAASAVNFFMKSKIWNPSVSVLVLVNNWISEFIFRVCKILNKHFNSLFLVEYIWRILQKELGRKVLQQHCMKKSLIINNILFLNRMCVLVYCQAIFK